VRAILARRLRRLSPYGFSGLSNMLAFLLGTG
jgi:hypothetical protein